MRINNDDHVLDATFDEGGNLVIVVYQMTGEDRMRMVTRFSTGIEDRHHISAFCRKHLDIAAAPWWHRWFG